MSFHSHTRRQWPRPPAEALAAVTISAIVALGCLALAGCGGGGPDRIPVFKTAGRITFKNQPASGAFLVLHPKNVATPNAPRPTAHVQADGTFQPTTFDSADGAPAGEYVVTVEWRKLVNDRGEWVPGPNLLPAKYSDPARSDVIVKIAAGQNDLPPIALR